MYRKQQKKSTEIRQNRSKNLALRDNYSVKIYFSYGFGSWEVNKENVTVITHVVHWEVLFFIFWLQK